MPVRFRVQSRSACSASAHEEANGKQPGSTCPHLPTVSSCTRAGSDSACSCVLVCIHCHVCKVHKVLARYNTCQPDHPPTQPTSQITAQQLPLARAA
eukprot:260129-Chlamydomonas_euryale.AAC.3